MHLSILSAHKIACLSLLNILSLIPIMCPHTGKNFMGEFGNFCALAHGVRHHHTLETFMATMSESGPTIKAAMRDAGKTFMASVGVFPFPGAMLFLWNAL